MEKEISKSTKRRQEASYSRDKNGNRGKDLHGFVRHFKQIVVLTDSGVKSRKGRPGKISKTMHVPA